MKNINLIKLILSLLICYVAAGVGSYFTSSAIAIWYIFLNKPVFSPPDWLFAPVWTILYAMMGTALYIVWNKTVKANKDNSYKYFFAQLTFNTIWSIAFFGLRNPRLGLFVIVVMWILIFMTIKNFSKISKMAAYLLYPYLAWVSFASILNLSIVLLNK